MELQASTVPVVATWQGISPLDFPTVDTDDLVGIPLALKHLTDLGHSRIALASADLPLDNRQREDAYRQFMREHAIDVPAGYVQRVPNSLDGGELALATLFAQREPPTAVVATTDIVAIGVLHRAWALGVPVPRDLSVVGYDDLYLAAHTVPPLTTVRMPVHAILREALRMVTTLARGWPLAPDSRVIRFSPTLVVRKSTATPGGDSI
jgi:DNA-binding LacI/PurR family transcriptional regulator